MKVIIRERIENLGMFGDVVRVADGYARNFLIPKGLAVEATDGNVKQVNAEKEAFAVKEATRLAKAEKLAEGLSAVTLSFARKSGEDDRLFGSVTSHDVEEALKAKGFKVDRKEIHLHEPIKNIGIHTVSVKLHPGVTANITVDVVKE
ncbi:MAG: 50S ribosomal protein L9 [Deltaproteobacteria bacterium]|nr:50S ribosomal protein L9 [Deltaproteobacteria bacterium]